MCQILEILSHQMIWLVCVIELIYLICFHDSFIDQLQLLLMLLSCISSYTLDCCYISQVFLTDFWDITDSDSDLSSELTVIIIRFRHMYNKIMKQVMTDKECLHMNISSMLWIISTVSSVMLSVIILLHHLVINADKLTHSLFILKYLDQSSQC